MLSPNPTRIVAPFLPFVSSVHRYDLGFLFLFSDKRPKTSIRQTRKRRILQLYLFHLRSEYYQKRLPDRRILFEPFAFVPNLADSKPVHCHYLNLANNNAFIQLGNAIDNGIRPFFLQGIKIVKSRQYTHRLHTGCISGPDVYPGITNINALFSSNSQL